MRELKKRTELELLETTDTDDQRMDAYAHLAAFGRLINRHLRAKMSKLNVNLPGVGLLYTLRLQFDAITPTHLTKRMGMTKHAISRSISELENAGLVKRSINPANRRMTLIRLTPKGTKYADEIIDFHRQIAHQVMSNLDEQELSAFDRTLKKIRHHFLQEVVGR